LTPAPPLLRAGLLALALLLASGAPGPARATSAAPPPRSVLPAARDPLAATLPPALAPFLRPLPPGVLLASDPHRRRLALFLALARRYDARHAFSASPAWRSTRGWPSAGETPFTWDEEALDETPARYPTRRGRSSPADDFAASVARANTDPAFACAFPIRARALYDAGLVRDVPAIERPGGCPAFDAWAAPERVAAVELVFASPSWSSPASSAGHVFLRLRAPADGPFVGDSAERVLGHGVDMTREDPDAGFVFRGLTGGYHATLLTSNSYARWLEYGAAEQRDLVVYELVLTPRERRYLLAELWRQHDAGLAVRYFFLSINCARVTWDALRAAVPDLPRDVDWYFHPHELVSNLLRLRRARPLGMVLSQRTKARRGETVQAELAPSLVSVPGFLALHNARFGPTAARAAALTAFANGLDVAALDPVAAAALARYLDATLEIETLATDVDGGESDPRRTGPALDAALALRARLPIATPPRALPRRRAHPLGVAALDCGARLGRRPRGGRLHPLPLRPRRGAWNAAGGAPPAERAAHRPRERAPPGLARGRRPAPRPDAPDPSPRGRVRPRRAHDRRPGRRSSRVRLRSRRRGDARELAAGRGTLPQRRPEPNPGRG